MRVSSPIRRLALRLGVNIDHVATIRQARGGSEPDPVKAATVAERAGCHAIVAHLREDRRHIQDADIRLLREVVVTRLNLEMSVACDIVRIACDVRPDQATLVPERRRELTTEGGLDVVAAYRKIRRAVFLLETEGITSSLFVDPVRAQITAARDCGARAVEIHTGAYANAGTERAVAAELRKIRAAARYGRSLGLAVYAGHGLTYRNVGPIAGIAEIEELNIGHSIIAGAVMMGLDAAVRRMLREMKKGC